jgi:hypothetical protein
VAFSRLQTAHGEFLEIVVQQRVRRFVQELAVFPALHFGYVLGNLCHFRRPFHLRFLAFRSFVIAAFAFR